MKQKYTSGDARIFFPFCFCRNCFEFVWFAQELKLWMATQVIFLYIQKVQYLIESNCLRQEKEEIVALKTFFNSRTIKKVKINEVK